MIKLNDNLHVAADAVAAVEIPERTSRDIVRVTMKDGTRHDIECVHPLTPRKESERIITEIDVQLTIMHGGGDS